MRDKRTTSFRIPVLGILGLCSKEKMFRPDTERGVAFMENTETNQVIRPARKISSGKNP